MGEPPKQPPPAWRPVLPVPPGTPVSPLRHSVRGAPHRVFQYLDAEGLLLGYTARFHTSSGDWVHLPRTWCEAEDGSHMWRWMQFPRLRPLYGLDVLAQRPEDTVLIVFDEFSVQSARTIASGFVSVSWPGGIRNIDEVDWSTLKGRHGIIWPDVSRQTAKLGPRSDPALGSLLPRERQPMWIAALKLRRILEGLGAKFILVDPFREPDLPDGWNLVQAEADGWDREKTYSWMPGHLYPDTAAEVGRLQEFLRTGKLPAPVDAPPKPVPGWIDNLLYRNGEVLACLANAYDILAGATEWAGVLAFDEFAARTVKLRSAPFGGEAGEWSGLDDTLSAMWLQRVYGAGVSSALMAEAVEALAQRARFHPVRDWLRTLKWDGVARLDDWISDCLGAEKTEFTQRVGRWFLVGMVARVMCPGVQFDYCLVLEGLQGKGKSSALSILGGDWFGDTDLDLHNKDSMSALRGKWLYEFPELGSLARTEAMKHKSFLTRRVDEFRPVYGRREIRLPRQTAFAGSTNEWEWNKDSTGGRRFWPIECRGEINLALLRELRDQLFAEATARYDQGEAFHPSPAEQRDIFDPEQLRREQPEALVDALHDWVESLTREFSVAEAGMEGLDLDASKLTRDMQTRIGIALRKLGCTRVERRNGMVRRLYKPPERTAARSSTEQPAQQIRPEGGRDVPF